MARECGWTKDYIADNLTVAQIGKYCELIQKQKMRDHAFRALSVFKAVGTAFGSIKLDDFKKFIEAFDPDSECGELTEKEISELKKSGIIEEG